MHRVQLRTTAGDGAAASGWVVRLQFQNMATQSGEEEGGRRIGGGDEEGRRRRGEGRGGDKVSGVARDGARTPLWARGQTALSETAENAGDDRQSRQEHVHKKTEVGNLPDLMIQCNQRDDAILQRIPW